MIYQGSKSRLKKYILPIIQDYIDTYNIKAYIEPFVGGQILSMTLSVKDASVQM